MVPTTSRHMSAPRAGPMFVTYLKLSPCAAPGGIGLLRPVRSAGPSPRPVGPDEVHGRVLADPLYPTAAGLHQEFS